MQAQTHSYAVRILERLGGASRMVTLLTFAIHFLHPLFSLTNYIYWARRQEAHLGAALVRAYIAMDVVACVAYLFVASVFYMWAWRFPEPEEVAKRRRIYGIGFNLLFSDIPLFVIETMMVQKMAFANGVQGFTYVLTCVSCAYSLLRFWTFWMVRMIKVRLPRRYNERYTVAQPQYTHRQDANQDLDRMMERVGEDGEEGEEEEENGGTVNDDGGSADGDDFYGPSASRYYNQDPDRQRRANDMDFRTPPGTTIIGANNNEGGGGGGDDDDDNYNNNDYEGGYRRYDDDDDVDVEQEDDEPYRRESRGGGGGGGGVVNSGSGGGEYYGSTRPRRPMADPHPSTPTPTPRQGRGGGVGGSGKKKWKYGSGGVI